MEKFTRENGEPPIESTLERMIIELSNEHENASDAIRVNRETDSNAIRVSQSHREKQHNPRIVI
jgi:hypothetical protein